VLELFEVLAEFDFIAETAAFSSQPQLLLTDCHVINSHLFVLPIVTCLIIEAVLGVFDGGPVVWYEIESALLDHVHYLVNDVLQLVEALLAEAGRRGG